jgi:hypothetical protein
MGVSVAVPSVNKYVGKSSGTVLHALFLLLFLKFRILMLIPNQNCISNYIGSLITSLSFPCRNTHVSLENVFFF